MAKFHKTFATCAILLWLQLKVLAHPALSLSLSLSVCLFTFQIGY